MTIFLVLVPSLAVALLRGGRPGLVAQFPLRHLWLAFVPLGLQLIIFTPLGAELDRNEALTKLIYLVSMVVAALMLLLNRHIPGLAWIAVGLLLNLGVIALNGGLMPVSLDARRIAGMSPLTGRAGNVIPITDETVLPWLADVIPLPAWMPLANVMSFGDVLIAFGAVLFTQRALFPTRAARNENGPRLASPD